MDFLNVPRLQKYGAGLSDARRWAFTVGACRMTKPMLVRSMNEKM